MLHRDIVVTNTHQHVVVRSNVHNDEPLHVYIGGDGRPFDSTGKVARDPTPSRAYVMGMISRDVGEAAYVARPCYHGTAGTSRCDPTLWSVQRFSRKVIGSMVEAIQEVAGDREVILIGYSGGGAVAMLAAPYLPRITGIITVAGNLSVSAWADYHGYTPLLGLDPATRLALTRGIPQIHFLGGSDENVPPSLTFGLKDQIPPQTVRVIEGYDHTCCWTQHWPEHLAAAREALSQQRDHLRDPQRATLSSHP